MSRAAREIAALQEALRVAEARRAGLRAEMDRAQRAHPDCPGCAAYRADLDAARELVDALAAEAHAAAADAWVRTAFARIGQTWPSIDAGAPPVAVAQLGVESGPEGPGAHKMRAYAALAVRR